MYFSKETCAIFLKSAPWFLWHTSVEALLTVSNQDNYEVKGNKRNQRTN